MPFHPEMKLFGHFICYTNAILFGKRLPTSVYEISLFFELY